MPRRGRRVNTTAPRSVLEPLDWQARYVLRVMNRADGPLTRSQLQHETGMPKTTLWRRIDDLRRAGLVECEQPTLPNPNAKPRYGVAFQYETARED